MTRPRHRRSTGAPLRAVLATIKMAALAGLLGGVALGGVRAEAPGDGTATATQAGAPDRVVERAVADHDCTYTGFDPGTVPASALIRTDAGRVRQVSFEVGWDVYNGRRPGTLIAVCLDETG